MKMFSLSKLTVILLLLTFQYSFAAEPRVVKVGSDDHFPVIFHDKDGVAQGLYVDLLTEIGRKENIRFEYYFGTWENTLNLVKSGEIDLLPGVGYTTERAQFMDYCKVPLLTVWGELYVLQSSEIKSILDISGKKIGVIKSDINAKNFLELTKRFHVKCEFVELTGYEDVFKAVKTKVVDAGVVGVTFGASKQGEYGLRSTGVVFNRYDLYISTTKDKNQDLMLILDKYLSEWKNQDISVFNNAKLKWIYGSVGTVAVVPDWLIKVFSLLGFVILFALAFIILLNLRVKKSTKALKESAERFRSLVTNIPGIVYRCANDANWTMLFISHEIDPVSDYPASDFINNAVRSYSSIIHPDDRDLVDRAVQKGVKEKAAYTMEYRICRADGHIRWVHEQGQGVFAPNGNLLWLDGVILDISERRQVEEEKFKLEAQLFQSQKMEAIGTLAGGIAHDFNNILSVIIGYTELARDRNQKENKEHYLQDVLKGAERARNLVKQILTFSRQDGNEKKPLDIKVLLKEAVKFLRSSIPSTVEINQQLTKEECNIMADPTQMHQVIMNLCTNAAHAMKDTGGTLKIDLANLELAKDEIPNHPELQQGHYVKLTVSDTGYGIDPALIQRVFDPFFTTKSVDEGTGLGLSVVYGIVKGHGGVINVYSEPGKGAIFHVYLPRIMQTETMEEDAGKTVMGGTERILFVDDEPSLVDIGMRMLSSLGYRTTVAENSIEALEIFTAGPQSFDLVITDMTLPKMTGIDLSRKLLQIRPEIPIILCSGIKEPETEARAKSLGIKAYLTKPLTRKELARVIREVLGEKAED